MKSLIKVIEFLPVIVFFVSYRLTSNMIVATAMIVGSCIVASALEYMLTKSLSRMQIFLTAAVVLFGVPTVLLNDPEIIKWKVTVVNLILAFAIGFTQYILHKNPFSYLFGKELPLPPAAWNSLSTLWMFYFVFAAGLNVIIAFYLPALTGISAADAEIWWVDYNTFGNAILNFIFAIVCLAWLFKKYPNLMAQLNAKTNKDI